jgi:hypothetical protein
LQNFPDFIRFFPASRLLETLVQAEVSQSKQIGNKVFDPHPRRVSLKDFPP